MTNKVNRKFTLNELNAYARSLTTKQTHMLYENRMHKKYIPLNESFEPDSDDYFTVFIPNEVVKNHDMTLTDLVNAVVFKRDYIKYKATRYGLYFYTVIPDDYRTLLGVLAEQGFADDIRDTVEEKYRSALDVA